MLECPKKTAMCSFTLITLTAEICFANRSIFVNYSSKQKKKAKLRILFVSFSSFYLLSLLYFILRIQIQFVFELQFNRKVQSGGW